MSYHPIVVTLSFLKPFFFNGLKKELCFSNHAWSIRPRNPIRAPVQATVLALTEKRVKIEADDDGDIVIRYVPLENLQGQG